MDRDFLLELFSAFGPVSLRRMFSGYGVSVDGITFALVLRGGIFLRTDAQTVGRFEEEGLKPFQYESRSRGRTVTVASYWQMPDRLYDDPEELADWARQALGAAERVAALKRTGPKRRKASATGPAVKKATRKKPAARKSVARKSSAGAKKRARAKAAPRER